MSETIAITGGNATIVITGAMNIRRYQLLTIEKGLQLQVKTGLGFTGNRVVNAAKAVLLGAGIQPARKHSKLLAQIQQYRQSIENSTGDSAPQG